MNARDLLSSALRGEPFPWQESLLAEMLRGAIPRALDIPTGLGKTATMAIWLVARACGAKLPRRLVYVVDRRAVVDQATDIAVGLREFVDGDPDIKRTLGLSENQPLPVSTLRGHLVDNRAWLDDPAAPAIVVGTVDMIGSRLLFEGYGVSRRMRPYHAGFLGADTLVVLDEAHLLPPFEHLLRSIETDPELGARDEASRKSVPPFRLMTLSATGRTRSDSVLGLTEEDLEHQVVRKRLYAKKSLRIEALDGEAKLEEKLAELAWRLAGDGNDPVRVLIYSDSREVARRAQEAVERLAKGNKKAGKPPVQIATELFVGGRRVLEREAAKERLESLGFIAGSPVERKCPVFLFATSAGEVGVDLDADHMVCDLVPWERMVQRLGRVNRRGHGEAKVLVIEPQADKKTQQVLEKEKQGESLTDNERKKVEEVRRLTHVRQLIERLPQHQDGSYDASPKAIRDLKIRAATDEALHQLHREATTPEPLRPALTRPLVEAWAMTSLQKHTGRPELQPWLRGWVEDDPPQTAVVWRTHLPVRVGGPTPAKKEIEDFFETAPPHTSELLETETFRVVEWITARAAKVRDQRKGQANAIAELGLRDEDVVAFVLHPDGALRKSLKLGELDPSEKTKKDELKSLLAGATLVLDAHLGGLKDGLLDEKEDPLPRTADDGQDWLGEGVIGFRVRSIDASEWVSQEKNWRERFRFAQTTTEDGEVTRWLIVEKWRHDAATEEDRSTGHPQLLDEHQSWTEERARRLAKGLGLDDGLVEVLALAARLHDEGKRTARWQRAFHAPKDGVYAKTEGPIDYRLLDGYRHELGSVLRLENGDELPPDIRERIQRLSPEHRELVLHLIAAHHGFARPVIGTLGCDDAPPFVLGKKAAEIALRFARLQDRWGPWGLAWLEALLRAADQQASRDNENSRR